MKYDEVAPVISYVEIELGSLFYSNLRTEAALRTYYELAPATDNSNLVPANIMETGFGCSKSFFFRLKLWL